MKKNYNCLIAGLPDIAIDDRKLPFNLAEFRLEVANYMSREDAKLIDLFFLKDDNSCVLSLLKKEKPSPELNTVFPLSVLEEEILEPDSEIPSYLSNFITDYKEGNLKYKMSDENVMSWMYYDYAMTCKNKFVADYLEFEMNVKNIVAAINSRVHKLDIEKAIIGDNEIAIALRTVNSKDFGIAMDYPYAEKIISLMEKEDLVARERGIDLVVWNYLDEAVVFEYFSIERVISFMLKLRILERWSKMTSESGRTVFMELVDKFKSNFNFDNQYKI